MRMLIRQNPMQQTAFDPETALICARLACGIIHTHDVFTARYPEARASGYFTTSSMVECVYHLAPVLHYSKDTEEHSAAVVALKRAHNILTHLSSKLNVSKKALRALSGVMMRWGSETSTSDVIREGITDTPAENNNARVSDKPTASLLLSCTTS